MTEHADFQTKIVPAPGRDDVLVVTVASGEGIAGVAELLRKRYPGTAVVFCRPGDDLTTLDEGAMRQLGWVRIPTSRPYLVERTLQ